MSFEGSGKSKKDAKLNASKALLVHLHQVGFDPMTGDMMSTQQNNTDVASGHSFADKIGQMVSHVTRTFDFSLNLYHQTIFLGPKQVSSLIWHHDVFQKESDVWRGHVKD